MAEEFQAGICDGNWWSTPKRAFMGGLFSPCSVVNVSDVGTYGSWVADMVDLKARSSCKEPNNSVSDHSPMVFQNSQKPQAADSDHGGGGTGSSMLTDSSLQMMGFGLSSSSSSPDWNRALLRGSERAENYNSMLQEEKNSGLNSSPIRKNWSPRSLISSTGQESSITPFKEMNQDFSIDQQRLYPVNSSGGSTATYQGLSTGFPIWSSAYGCSSPMIQSLFEPDSQPQQSLFNNQSMNFSSTANYSSNLNELSATWPKLSSFLEPSLQNQQPAGGLHFSNNTPFWNASATALNDVRASLLPLSRSQFLVTTFEEQPNNCPSLSTNANNEDGRGSGLVVSKESEPAFKRPRIEAPSPLPTFKVRKEKLGDRITALQQLVSPFGKTDTASVLHEAIEYIKFLHDQVNVLSAPYMKNDNSSHHQQAYDKLREAEGPKQDLRSQGLCLVPISSTFPVANETTADFGTPTFGGSFR